MKHGVAQEARQGKPITVAVNVDPGQCYTDCAATADVATCKRLASKLQ